MEDHHQAVLELGGQVEGEAGPRQAGQGRGHLLQDVAQDVVAAGASAALAQETGEPFYPGGARKELTRCSSRRL